MDYSKTELLSIIKQGRKKFDLEDYFNFILLLPLIFILGILIIDFDNNKVSYFIGICLVVSVIYLIINRIFSNIKFRRVYTGKTKKENLKFAKKMLQQSFGNYKAHNAYLQARTKGNFFYPGDLFTIIFIDNYLFINYKPIPIYKGASLSFYSGIKNYLQLKKRIQFSV